MISCGCHTEEGARYNAEHQGTEVFSVIVYCPMHTAAPELLAACKLLDATIQEWRETGNINYKHWNIANDQLRAAIKKSAGVK